MREFEHEVGIINIESEIGLSGHAGLADEIYRLPVQIFGMYRVTTVTDEILRRRCINLLNDGCSWAQPSFSAPVHAMTNESHGGIMIADFAHMMQLKGVLEEESETDKCETWNQVAEGFSDQIASLPLGPGLGRTDFAMISGHDYFCAYPVIQDGKLCGYSILCDCTHEGVQRDGKPHRWDEIEARGELPARLNSKGWVTCPHCGIAFKTTAASLWNGFRHLRCGGQIKLVKMNS